MSKKVTTEEEIKKSIEELVDKALKAEKASEGEDLSKSGAASVSKDTDRPSNGGEDRFKSGSPETENQTMYKDKKGNMYKSLDEAFSAGAEITEKVELDGEGNVLKSTEYVNKAKKEDEKEEREEEKEEKKEMKKSFGDLDEEEIELVKAWREEKREEEEKKPYAEIQKSMTAALSEVVEPLKKSIEDRDEIIKSLTDKIDKLSNQPAYDKRSVDTLEPLEKGGEGSADVISKSQVLDTMLDLQLEGKGITAHHVAEFEATRNISDPRIKQLVMSETKKRVLGN